MRSARYSPLVFPKRVKSGGKTCTCALAEAMRSRLSNKVSLVFMLVVYELSLSLCALCVLLWQFIQVFLIPVVFTPISLFVVALGGRLDCINNLLRSVN